MDAKVFWKYSMPEWYATLGSSANGLSEEQVSLLHARSGNKKVNASPLHRDIRLFASQFKNPLMLLLIGAVILSAFLGDTSDVFIILFIVLSTSLLSFFQERNANRVVEKLQSMVSLKCSVVRGGQLQTIDSGELVPGDILQFKAGDLVPADCLLVTSNELYTNEASITGESFPVRKETGVIEANTELAKRSNCLWEGTNIVSGKATALVILTNADTLFGNIAQRASAVQETAFEKGIKDFGYFLMKITLILAAAILFVNLLNQKGIVESALFALALAVGMAPELLPAISTIAMSAGAKRMLEKKVIVRKLTSIQNLGEIDLLCTDKTGTITEGIIEVAAITDPFGETDETVRKFAIWNAQLETGYANPMDEALKKLTTKSSLPEKIGEVPYDFVRKRLSIGIKTSEGVQIISKGAFQQIINVCTYIRTKEGNTEPLAPHLGKLQERFESYGQQGVRTIGICYKHVVAPTVDKLSETEMIFAGFILLNDPVKKDITTIIHNLSALKVDLKIITGDNMNVARSTALSIGIDKPQVMTGKELSITSSEALTTLVKSTHIFAEVEPQQKERIILALKQTYTVAYMGDGINDVAAINAADVGISVENAVDVAREAADFVLLEKNLSVLIEGIREGRKTFANTLKYLYISTGSTFGNMCSVAAASVLLPFLPMLPKQILLTNFLTDFPFLTVASDNVDEEQIDKPGRWNLKLIRNYMVVFGVHSSLFDLLTFSVLLFILKAPESAFQTGWFIESVLSEIFILFIIRTHKNFFTSKPSRYLILLSVVALTLTITLPYASFAPRLGLTPLPAQNLLSMLGLVIAYCLTADILKVWFFKRYSK